MTGEERLAELVVKLKKALDDALVSVVLYGSAASDDAEPGYSDLNVLCVLRQVTSRELVRTEEIVVWWRNAGNPSPLMLSVAELDASADCFPMEFHDLKARRRVLHGADPVEALVVHDVHYRTQVEYELRSKLIRLRNKAAGVIWDTQLLQRLYADSVSTFCVLFRHALRLDGVDGVWRKREVVDAAAGRFGIDATLFHGLLDLREGKIKSVDVKLDDYLGEIAKVVDAVDRLKQ